MDAPPPLLLQMEDVPNEILDQPEVIIKLAQSFVILLGYVEREYAACQKASAVPGS
jgi:hypothetical protein